MKDARGKSGRSSECCPIARASSCNCINPFALLCEKLKNATLRVDSIFCGSYVKRLLVVPDGSTEEFKGLQSWNDVLKLIEDAEDQYAEKAKHSWFRQKLRRGENVASVLQSLTDLLPEEYGLGVLRGGLSILFTVSW